MASAICKETPGGFIIVCVSQARSTVVESDGFDGMPWGVGGSVLVPMQPLCRPFQMCYVRTEGGVTREKKMGKKWENVRSLFFQLSFSVLGMVSSV